MTNYLPMTLAASEWVAVIVAVLFILGGIFGQAKQQKGKSRAGGAGGGGGDGAAGLDELARRRRAQLESLARQRGGGGGSVPTVTPDNLNVTEAMERQAAQAAYEARADQMRQEQGEARLAREQALAERKQMQTLEAEARRRAQLDRLVQRSQQPPPAKQKRRRNRPARQEPPPLEWQEEPAVPHMEREGETSRIGATPLGRGVTEVDAFSHPQDLDMVEVHRHVADAPASGAAAAKKSFLGQVMTGQDWRRMLVMREVLDKPVGLREE